MMLRENLLRGVAFFSIYLFFNFAILDAFPVISFHQQNKEDAIIQSAIELYKNGEYKEAIVKLLEAKEQAHTDSERSEIYFYLSLSYFASGDTANCEEYLTRMFEVDLERVVDEGYVPSGYAGTYHRLQGSARELKAKEKAAITAAKPEVKEEPPVIKAKEGQGKQVKKGKSGLWILGGLVIGGGVAAAILLGKKSHGGAGAPTTGTIQVNSSPTGAKVWLDNSDTGQVTDCTLANISPGNHPIKLIKEGYQDYETSVLVTAGQTAPVNANLGKNTITLTSPTSSTIWTKGKDVEIKWQTGNSVTKTTNISLNPIYYSRNSLLSASLGGNNNSITKPLSAERNSISSELIPAKDLSRYQDVQKRSSAPNHNSQSMTESRGMIRSNSRPWPSTETNASRLSRVNSYSPNLQGNRGILSITKVNIELYKGGTLSKTIASNIDNNSPYTYKWPVPASLSDGKDYKVRISCSADSNVYGESTNFKIQIPVPTAPANLSAEAVSSSEIDLNWKDKSDNEDGFKIERKEGQAGAWAKVATVGKNVINYANTGLKNNTHYYYRLYAYNDSGKSDYSNEANATTSESHYVDLTVGNLTIEGLVQPTPLEQQASQQVKLLEVRGIRLNDSAVIAASVTLRFTVKNLGNSTASNYYLEGYISQFGTKVYEFEGGPSTLSGGASESWYTPNPVDLASGTYKLVVIVNPSGPNRISEINYDNNQGSKTFTVY